MLCLGRLTGQRVQTVPLKLRRLNNIRTIHASLSIEGNTLGVEQVTQLMDGKRILGPIKDIQEVTNAIDVYSRLSLIDPLSEKHMMSTHGDLMAGLVNDAGSWRSGEVGIWQSKTLKHMAPPARRVPELMANLFDFLHSNVELTWLIKACIFHYEFEFIHPFSDGNGRMGRLWQQLLLMRQDPIFEFMPVEVMIKEEQDAYYKVLGDCDAQGESTLFIAFALQQILKTLEQFILTNPVRPDDVVSRLEYASSRFSQEWFSRIQYLELFQGLSTATASRDLAHGVEHGIMERTGKRNQVKYRFLAIE